MKWAALVPLTVLVVVLLGCAPSATSQERQEEAPKPVSQPVATGQEEMPATEAQPATVKRELSEQESLEIAEQFLEECPTYAKRGTEGSLMHVATTPREEAFSWQFDFQFQCRLPGYGRLGTEPTPQQDTPHRARVVVQEGTVVSAVLDDEWDVYSQVMIDASAATGNSVSVDFLTNWVHGVDGDSFTNAEVTGQRQWRISQIINTPDGTGEPVRGLRVTLETDLEFDWVDQASTFSRPGRLTRMGPPVYEWSFGDLAQAPLPAGQAYDVYVGFIGHTQTRVIPGFDLSRSFDRTVFTAPGIQTMTVTVTPREEWVERVSIQLSTWEDELVDPVFTSITGGQVSTDGRTAEIRKISLEFNTPLTVTVTIRVTPKVSSVEYKPNVRVSPCPLPGPHDISSGTVSGSSFACEDEAGTWTVSAEGDYVWHWIAHRHPGRDVALGPVSR